ncbi:hypothetical protein ACVRW4_00395 [Streptococcus phocae subsp. phocae]
MDILKTFFKINLKLALVLFALIKPLLDYLEKDLHRSMREMALREPAPVAPDDTDLLAAIAADEKKKSRRKMLDKERQARIAEERARQTQHHQDKMRAAQARSDADKARKQY